jgi:hypothetical protein
MSMRFWLALITVGVLLVGCAQTGGLQDKIVSLYDAVNRHDVSGELAFFATDVTFQLYGDPPIVGRTGLRQLFEWDSTLSCSTEIGDLVVSGDTVTVNRMVEYNDWMRLAGAQPVSSLPGSRFIFQNGLIKHVEMTGPVAADVQAFLKRRTLFLNWLAYAHPETIRELQDGCWSGFNRTNAAHWVALLSEWKEYRSSRGALN